MLGFILTAKLVKLYLDVIVQFENVLKFMEAFDEGVGGVRGIIISLQIVYRLFSFRFVRRILLEKFSSWWGDFGVVEEHFIERNVKGGMKVLHSVLKVLIMIMKLSCDIFKGW